MTYRLHSEAKYRGCLFSSLCFCFNIHSQVGINVNIKPDISLLTSVELCLFTLTENLALGLQLHWYKPKITSFKLLKIYLSVSENWIWPMSLKVILPLFSFSGSFFLPFLVFPSSLYTIKLLLFWFSSLLLTYALCNCQHKMGMSGQVISNDEILPGCLFCNIVRVFMLEIPVNLMVFPLWIQFPD